MEHILLLAGMLLGLAIIPFGLPGAIVILVSVLIYALATNFSADVGVGLFVMLCILTAVAETADNWLTALGARRYGATSVSVWLSFVGGLAGAILIGGPLAFRARSVRTDRRWLRRGVPYRFRLRTNSRQNDTRGASRRLGTFVGRMAGLVLKFVIAVAMIIAVAVKILL